MLVLAELGYITAQLGEGRIEVETVREWLGRAECAVQLAVAARDSDIERSARRLVRQIGRAIRANEPG
jgi:hypothetical protein